MLRRPVLQFSQTFPAFKPRLVIRLLHTVDVMCSMQRLGRLIKQV